MKVMDTISSNNLIIPASEVPQRTYFLQAINTPFAIWTARIVILLIVLVFIGVYMYIRKQKKTGEK